MFASVLLNSFPTAVGQESLSSLADREPERCLMGDLPPKPKCCGLRLLSNFSASGEWVECQTTCAMIGCEVHISNRFV